MGRKKWLEKVEFTECSTDKHQQCKIIMQNDETGDLYLTVCPADHNGGPTVRIERSGGASTHNPRLVQALTIAYDALAGNDELYHISNVGLDDASDCDIEELLARYDKIKDLAGGHAEEEKMKRALIKNFRNEYKIISK